jgi:cobalt-zinc-cadmium efflux system protein
MSGVALGGLFVNLLMLRLLHGGHEHNLNLRGAWLHVVGDLLGSVAVLIAATVIHRGWLWMDPLVSVLISLLIVASSWRLLKEAVSILMEHSPHTVQVDEVRRALLAQPAVAGVHCLHVWSIASGFHSISAHIVLQPGQERCELLADLRSDLQQKFAVEHVTLQLEPANFTGCDEGSANGCRVGSGKAVNHAADGCSRERTCDAQAAH